MCCIRAKKSVRILAEKRFFSGKIKIPRVSNDFKFGDVDGLNLCRVNKVDVSSTFY